jgi:hypothetical protein
MNTYYVRHTAKMDVDAATRDHLWNGQLVGIHFPQRLPPTPDAGPDNDSLNPTDYPQPARSAMSVFARMSEAGGYVLAEYFGHPGCLVGVIERGTPLSLYRGKWGNRWGRSGQEAVLKTLQLSQVKIVTEVNAAKLLVGRPRQGTAMQWHSARQMIKNFLLGVTTHRVSVTFFLRSKRSCVRNSCGFRLKRQDCHEWPVWFFRSDVPCEAWTFTDSIVRAGSSQAR